MPAGDSLLHDAVPQLKLVTAARTLPGIVSEIHGISQGLVEHGKVLSEPGLDIYLFVLWYGVVLRHV